MDILDVLCVVLIIIFIGLIFYGVNMFKEREEYCKTVGWDEYTHVNGQVCVKYENHPSGLGTYEVYSGSIDWSIIT